MIAAGQMVVTSAWGAGDSIAFGSCAPRPPCRLPVIEDIDYHGIWAPGCKARYAQTAARKTCAYTLSGSTCCSATAAAAGMAPAWRILAGYPLVGRAKGGWELVPRQCDPSARNELGLLCRLRAGRQRSRRPNYHGRNDLRSAIGSPRASLRCYEARKPSPKP